MVYAVILILNYNIVNCPCNIQCYNRKDTVSLERSIIIIKKHMQWYTAVLNTIIYWPWFRIRLKHILTRTKLECFADWHFINFEEKCSLLFFFKFKNRAMKIIFFSFSWMQVETRIFLIHINRTWKYKLNLHY